MSRSYPCWCMRQYACECGRRLPDVEGVSFPSRCLIQASARVFQGQNLENRYEFQETIHTENGSLSLVCSNNKKLYSMKPSQNPYHHAVCTPQRFRRDGHKVTPS